MAVSLFDTGIIRVTVRYVRALKPGAPYSYYRRIPDDLRSHYGGKTFRRISLKTRDLHEAIRRAARFAAEDDALWATLQSHEGRRDGLTTPENRVAARALLRELGLEPGALTAAVPSQEGLDVGDIWDDHMSRQHGNAYLDARHEPETNQRPIEDFYSPVEAEAMRLLKEDPRKPRALLSDALSIYLSEHPKGEMKRFSAGVKLAIGFVVSSVGDLPLPYYHREQARKVRDDLLRSGNKTGTVRRRLNDIKAVFNKGLVEFDLKAHANPFEKLHIVNEEEDSKERIAFTSEELLVIAKACRSKDDDIRHIVALQADSGARLGEIVGLRLSDVVIDHETPHIIIQPHPSLGRTLKNANSERVVPLIGEALWGAQRAVKAAQGATRGSGWLFPRYASDGNVKANGASVAINKWLVRTLKAEKTTHSFRHAMRDRLRHAGVPNEFQDLIGGWGNRTVGQGYGEGYLLRQLREQMEKVSSAASQEKATTSDAVGISADRTVAGWRTTA